jgi:hypothetical protein
MRAPCTFPCVVASRPFQGRDRPSFRCEALPGARRSPAWPAVPWLAIYDDAIAALTSPGAGSHEVFVSTPDPGRATDVVGSLQASGPRTTRRLWSPLRAPPRA